MFVSVELTAESIDPRLSVTGDGLVLNALKTSDTAVYTCRHGITMESFSLDVHSKFFLDIHNYAHVYLIYLLCVLTQSNVHLKKQNK